MLKMPIFQQLIALLQHVNFYSKGPCCKSERFGSEEVHEGTYMVHSNRFSASVPLGLVGALTSLIMPLSPLPA